MKRRILLLPEQIKHIFQTSAITFEVFIRVIRTKDLFTQGNAYETDWTMSFSSLDCLQIVKEIRKKTNAKFATIMMTAVTGALKRMYIEDKKYSEEFPEQIWIESPLGLPNHPAMTKGGKFCNHL